MSIYSHLSPYGHPVFSGANCFILEWFIPGHWTNTANEKAVNPLHIQQYPTDHLPQVVHCISLYMQFPGVYRSHNKFLSSKNHSCKHTPGVQISSDFARKGSDNVNDEPKLFSNSNFSQKHRQKLSILVRSSKRRKKWCDVKVFVKQ